MTRTSGNIQHVMAQARISRWLALPVVLGMLITAGCGGSADGGQETTGDGDLHGEVTVFAAASLTESFTELRKMFEKQHPDVEVRTSFAGSSSLARQIVRGAPAGVFASANVRQMKRTVDAGSMASDPVTFVRNKLQIAVPAGNPADIDGLAAFGKQRLRIAVCAEQVPCGAAARKALRAADIELSADSLEQDVKAVLTKVRLGEVDAGLVYRTDVASAGDAVEGIGFPAADKAVNNYEIATVADAPNPTAAKAFVDFVQSPRAQHVLAEYGFETDSS